jgi:hypothetical protein
MKTQVNPVKGRIEEQPHGGALFRPEKGETANRRGRPRKFVSKLREDGYTRSEVNDAIQVLLAMTEAELSGVFDNPAATALEKTIASALMKGIEQGSLAPIDSLLTRAYGKPKETMTLSQEEHPRIEITLGGLPPSQEVAS